MAPGDTNVGSRPNSARRLRDMFVSADAKIEAGDFHRGEAKMGIPNLANRRRGGQEWQSRSMLAMPNLAIHPGYHRPAGTRQPGRHIAASPCPGGYHRQPRSNPTEGMVSRRQVAYPFFRVVQIRTALVVTPYSQPTPERLTRRLDELRAQGRLAEV